MNREWTDPRDGRAWKIDAGAPAVPGQPFPLTFRSGDSVLRVDHDGRPGPEELEDRHFEGLLDQAVASRVTG